MVDPEDVGDESIQMRACHDNGIELNGTRFNGTRFNGTCSNGVKLILAQLVEGATKKSLTGWSLVPGTSELQAWSSTGELLRGDELAGARLHWLVDDGKQQQEVLVRIVGVTQSWDRPDIYFTDLDVRFGDSAWEPSALTARASRPRRSWCRDTSTPGPPTGCRVDRANSRSPAAARPPASASNGATECGRSRAAYRSPITTAPAPAWSAPTTAVTMCPTPRMGR